MSDPSTIPRKVIKKYRYSIFLNALAFALLTSLIFSIAYVGALMAFYNMALILAAAATGLVLLIGIIYQIRGCHDEARTVALPWEATSVGSYLARRELLKVTGAAYVINEIAMSASGCILTIFKKANLIRHLNAFTPDQYKETLMPLILRAKAGERFIPVSEIAGQMDFQRIKLLILTEIVWAKNDDGVVKVGVNREYDNAYH